MLCCNVVINMVGSRVAISICRAHDVALGQHVNTWCIHKNHRLNSIMYIERHQGHLQKPTRDAGFASRCSNLLSSQLMRVHYIMISCSEKVRKVCCQHAAHVLKAHCYRTHSIFVFAQQCLRFSAIDHFLAIDHMGQCIHSHISSQEYIKSSEGTMQLQASHKMA